MKRIGIFGGTSPESTALYYNHIIHEYTTKHTDHNYPEILIYSVSFQKIIDWINEKRLDLISKTISESLNSLHMIGADFGLIAAVTLHIVFDQVTKSVRMPLLSLIDATADAILRNNHSVVGLLGTKTTMAESFFRDGLKNRGIKTLVPNNEMQDEINEILFGELAFGTIRGESRQRLLEIVRFLCDLGAQGIVLACTEIPLLLQQKHTKIPLYDTPLIHSQAALKLALED